MLALTWLLVTALMAPCAEGLTWPVTATEVHTSRSVSLSGTYNATAVVVCLADAVSQEGVPFPLDQMLQHLP